MFDFAASFWQRWRLFFSFHELLLFEKKKTLDVFTSQMTKTLHFRIYFEKIRLLRNVYLTRKNYNMFSSLGLFTPIEII